MSSNPQKPCSKCGGHGKVSVSRCAVDIFHAAVQLTLSSETLTFDSLYRQTAHPQSRDYPDSTFRAALGELLAAGHLHRDRSGNGPTGSYRWLITDQGNTDETT